MKRILFFLGLFYLGFNACDFPDDEFEPFYFRNGNVDLWVNIDGNRDSKVFIIYLHGGPGSGSLAYNMGYYSDILEEDYAVVYLDQRGNGASQGSYSKDELTIEDISNDIYQLTLFLKAQFGDDISVFLSGHSWGGLTSAHALIHTDIQEEIKGWIEIDGNHDFKQNEIEAVKMFQKLASEEIANGNNVDFWQPILEKVNQMDTLNITSSEAHYLNKTGFDAQGKFELTNSPATQSSFYYSINPNNPNFGLGIKASNLIGQVILNMDSENYRLTNELHKIEIPSLFLWGKYDFVVPPSMGQMAYDRVNTTEKELVIFETSGHSPMGSEAEFLTEKVTAFIESHK